MDEVVNVRRSFLNRMRAFFNIFAGRCKTCLRCSPYECSKCTEIAIAKRLMEEIDTVRNAEGERYFINNPFMEKAARVMKAISEAGRPISSVEINLEDLSRQDKHRILMRMVRIGILRSSKFDRGQYFYERGPSFEIFNNNINNETKGR